VKSAKDLDREVLKSDTAGIEIPDVELHLAEGGLGGVYTTVEGLLSKLHDRLKDANPFWAGDSVNKNHSIIKYEAKSLRFLTLLENLASMKSGNRFPFTLIIDDPLSNSFIGPIDHSIVNHNAQMGRNGYSTSTRSNDSDLDIVTYERTDDQNETLGFNSFKIEHDQDINIDD
jgi:zinc finger protein